MRNITLLIGLTLLAVGLSHAQIPSSAYIDNLSEDNYPASICYLASLGHLIQFEDPTVTVADIMTRTGMITQYAWADYNGGYIDPHKRIYDSDNKLFQGAEMDILRLMGVGYAVGYAKTGGAGYSVALGADEKYLFKNENEAVNHLKQTIASGTPVQVHLDFQYVREDAGVVYQFWANFPAGEQASHFVVIHGYDENYVYYTDNQPTQNTNDIDNDGQSDGVGVPLSWDNFLEAWYAAGEINKTDKNMRVGPWFMLYLIDGPSPAPKEAVLGYLYRDGIDGSDALRLAAQAITNGASPASCISDYLRGRKYEMTPHMADWLTTNGCSTTANLFSNIDNLWQSIRNTDTDSATVVSTLNDIADLQDSAWDLIEPEADLDHDIYTLSPEDNVLTSIDHITLRWVADPYFATCTVELAPTGNFSDTKNIIKLKSLAGKPFYYLVAKDWYQIFAKDGGDRNLLWRVKSAPADGTSLSAERILQWAPLTMTAVTPADSATLPANQDLQFTFTMPSLAKSPIIELSTTTDFTNKKLMLTLTPKKGLSCATLKAAALAKFLKKDNGDNTLYWRAIDKASKLTTVQPSQICTLTITTAPEP